MTKEYGVTHFTELHRILHKYFLIRRCQRRALGFLCLWALLHHSHARVTGWHSRGIFFDVCYNRFCCKQCRCNACCVLQSTSCNLCRIQNTCIYHIYIFILQCIVTDANFGFFYFIDDNAAFQTCVCCNVEQWSFQCFQNDLCTCLLITFQLICQLSNFFGSVDISRSTT